MIGSSAQEEVEIAIRGALLGVRCIHIDSTELDHAVSVWDYIEETCSELIDDGVIHSHFVGPENRVIVGSGRGGYGNRPDEKSR